MLLSSRSSQKKHNDRPVFVFVVPNVSISSPTSISTERSAEKNRARRAGKHRKTAPKWPRFFSLSEKLSQRYFQMHPDSVDHHEQQGEHHELLNCEPVFYWVCWFVKFPLKINLEKFDGSKNVRGFWSILKLSDVNFNVSDVKNCQQKWSELLHTPFGWSVESAACFCLCFPTSLPPSEAQTTC